MSFKLTLVVPIQPAYSFLGCIWALDKSKDLFAYATEFVRQFNDLEQFDRHDLWCPGLPASASQL